MSPRTALLIAAVLGLVLFLGFLSLDAPPDTDQDAIEEPAHEGESGVEDSIELTIDDAEITTDTPEPTSRPDELDGPMGPGESDLPRIRMSGAVLDPDRNPMTDAIVWFNTPVPTSNGVVRTTSDGAYTDLLVAPGQQEVWVLAAGYPRQSVLFEIPAPDDDGAWTAPDIVLVPGGIISGLIEYQDGTPASGVPIRMDEQGLGPLNLGRGLRIGTARTHSDAKGRFTFVGIGDGLHTVIPSADSLSLAPTCNPDRIYDIARDQFIRFRLEHRAWMTGVVLVAGSRAPIDRVLIEGREILTTDGLFEIPCEPGQDRVALEARGYRPQTVKVTPPLTGETANVGEVLLELAQNAGHLRVEVMDEYDRPVTEYTISSQGPLRKHVWKETVVDAGGVCRLGPFGSGNHKLLIESPGYEARSHFFDPGVATPGEPEWNPKLSYGGEVRLLVRDPAQETKRSIRASIHRDGNAIGPWIYECLVGGVTKRFVAWDGSRYLPYGDGTISGLAAGHYDFVISVYGKTKLTEFQVKEAGVTELVIDVDW